MIVNCPKCGFTQPKDRYCANCGVDMQAYRPKSAPLSSRILKSWIFQSAVLIVAIGTALSFLKLQKDREAQTQEMAFAQPPSALNNSNGESPPPPPPTAATVSARAPTPPPPVAQASPLANASAGARGVMPMGVNPPNGTRANPSTAQPSRAGDAAFSQMDLVFAEVPRTVLANLEAGSRMLESDSVSAGVYPNIAPLMRQLTTTGQQRVRSLRVLESARGLPVHINQPNITFKGMRDPTLDRNIGITTQIVPLGMDENGLHYQIEVQRVVRDTSGGVAEFTYQGDIVMPKGAGAFVAGLLPRRPLSPNERAALANAGVLKVLASQDFQEDLSEFVLFIEAR